MKYEILKLDKSDWKGTLLPISYTSEYYYDISVNKIEDGFNIPIKKKKFDNPFTHVPEDGEYPDKLFEDWWEKAEAFGIVENGELLAAVEVNPEEWSNRLMVTELWVSDTLRGKGIGKRLMDKAKEVAVRQGRRAIILETQSCNTNAIGFYLHQGFELIGFDTCCYTNNDIGRREIRLNLGYFFHREGRRR